MTEATIIRGQHIKSGDVNPNLRLQLEELGTPFNLDGYTVSISIQKVNTDTTDISDTLTIESASRGIVVYEWKNADTDETGTYIFECVATDSNGDTITFPNEGYQQLYIEEKL
jgi:hypothetical protein